MVTKDSMVYKARAIEFVVGSAGANIDIGITKQLTKEKYGD